MEWRPIRLIDKDSGREVMITIIDREMYLNGFWSFDNLYSIYEGIDNKTT